MTTAELISQLDGLLGSRPNFLIIPLIFAFVLAVAGLTLVIILLIYKNKNENTYRQSALKKLNETLEITNDKFFLRAINQILKDTARTSFSPKVATLTGQKWIKFLNLTSPEYLFSPLDLSFFSEIYDDEPITINRQHFIALARFWILKHKKINQKKLNKLYV